MSTTQRIVLMPGQTLDVVMTEVLGNGYPDETGSIRLHWQDRDAPSGEIATKGRELQIETMALGGRVGPIVVTHR